MRTLLIILFCFTGFISRAQDSAYWNVNSGDFVSFDVQKSIDSVSWNTVTSIFANSDTSFKCALPAINSFYRIWAHGLNDYLTQGIYLNADNVTIHTSFTTTLIFDNINFFVTKEVNIKAYVLLKNGLVLKTLPYSGRSNYAYSYMRFGSRPKYSVYPIFTDNINGKIVNF